MSQHSCGPGRPTQPDSLARKARFLELKAGGASARDAAKQAGVSLGRALDIVDHPDFPRLVEVDLTVDTPPTQRKTLKHGVIPHELTTEERRKGAETTNAMRREAAKSFRQKLAEKLDERADELADTLLAAGKDDWRALVAGLDQAFGKPTERHELTGNLEVESPDVVAAVERFEAVTVAAVRAANRAGTPEADGGTVTG